jgi:tetratricopeptide (TPR) repeat protein
MTQREAREHDFTKEFHQALVQVFQAQLAKNPRDQAALAALANEYRLLKNYAAAGETYERLFATDYQNPMLLNNLVYTYVEIGGTNLDLAYEQALKAQRLQPDDFVADTVGWVLFKRGDYDQALQVLRKVRAVDPVITFHLAMAYYMHMDEDAARSAFQDFLRQGRSGFQDFPRNSADEITEAKRCLEVLNVGQDNSAAIRRLKARLGQVPDDPVALSRFAALYEQGSGVRNDPLAAKAIGWQAYRRGDFPRAVQYLAESCKERPGDGDLFFYLGMAQHRLSRESECAQSLHKALILNVKHAQAEEAKKALASLSGT